MLFHKLAKVFEVIESKSGRLEMTGLLAELFKEASAEEAERIAYIVEGELLPPYMGVDMGIGEKFVLQAISEGSGYSRKEVEKEFEAIGDLGGVAEKLLTGKKQQSLHSEQLTIAYVYAALMKIAKSSGKGSQEEKIKRLVELYHNSKPLEARYITRFVLGQLRLGVGGPTILDALSFSEKGDKSLREGLDHAYNLCSDIGYVARKFKEHPHRMGEFKMEVFKPIMPALAERLANAGEIVKRLGKCAVESKYDGFRMSVHKKGGRVEIFSRRLERITPSFPDVVKAVEKLKPEEIIFEGEALAFNEKEKKFYSFQETMHRRRKYGVEEASGKYPLHLYVFDLHYLDGKDYTGKTYAERRKALEKIFPKGNLMLSDMKVVDTADELQGLFDKALGMGLEGIIAKDLKAPYTAGKRKFAWIKLKKSYGKTMDTVDALIVGYYRGKGSRTEFGFGGLLVAVYNEKKERFETIAKVGSGFTEEEMGKFAEELGKMKTKNAPADLDYKLEPDFWVKPKIVVEIAYDNITKSPVHTCGEEEGKGFALRFPRLVRIRDDKGPYDVTTTKEVRGMYKQAG
ncbi:MAG: ATP-dependent DNA ligase [Candidatus ainarchaeum sp.]|nr:ATP-dependent DNA ligase [Candidatus ainarchaeum sp.]